MERLCWRLHTKNVQPPQCAWLVNFVQSRGFFLRPAGSRALNWITDPVEHKRSCAEKEHIFCGIYSPTFSVLRAWLLCFSKYIAGVLLKSSVPAFSSTLTHFHKRHLVSVYFVDQRTDTKTWCPLLHPRTLPPPNSNCSWLWVTFTSAAPEGNSL